MVVTSKLSEQDFINANLVLLYSKRSIKIVTGLMLLFLFTTIFVAAFSANDFSQIFVPAVMLIALPLVTYFNAKRNFRVNSRISETIEFYFDNNYLLMKGKSFHAQFSWEKVHKVTQSKNRIFIWQTHQVANPIPKRDMQAEQVIVLKETLNNCSVKSNL